MDIPHVDNIIVSLLLHKDTSNEIIKEESYDSLLNDISSDTNEDMQYISNSDNVDNYHNVFNSNIIKYTDESENYSENESINGNENRSENRSENGSENESETGSIKGSKKENKNKSKNKYKIVEHDNMDDIKYFQKFSKTSII
jgi:hypothetical protein